MTMALMLWAYGGSEGCPYQAWTTLFADYSFRDVGENASVHSV